MSKTETEPRDWPGRKIAAAMFAAGISQARLARNMGKNAIVVNRVIYGKASSEPIERAVAKAIDEPYEVVFAGRLHSRAQRFAVNG